MIRYIHEIGDVRVIIEVDTAEEIVALRNALDADIGDEWIEWRGGEIAPVEDGTLIDVEFRDGDVMYGETAFSECWRHTYGSGDIVAYRVVKNV